MLAPPKLSTSSTKVRLARGRGPMDWQRLADRNDLAGEHHKGVTKEMMRAHADKWIILDGDVYNVAPYMEYHPGGIDELRRGTGTVGTALFNEIHPWINYKSMLRSCFVGPYVGSLADLPPTKPPPEEVNDAESKHPKSISLEQAKIRMEDRSKSGKLSVFVEFDAFKQLPKGALSVFAKEKNSMLRLLLRTPPYNESLEVEMVLTTPLSDNGESLTVQRVRQNVFQLQAPLEESAPSVSSGAVKVTKATKRPARYSCRVVCTDRVVEGCQLIMTLKPCNKHSILRVPVGHHVYLSVNDRSQGGDKVVRPYTPMFEENGREMRLLVKLVDNGRMSAILRRVRIGDKFTLSDAAGEFDIQSIFTAEHMLFLAGGSGITPFIPILNEWLSKGKKSAPILLYFNRKPEHVLWRRQLSEAQNDGRLHTQLYYSDMNSELDDNQILPAHKGRISKDLVQEILSRQSDWTKDKTVALVCGSLPFNEAATTVLFACGINRVQVFDANS